MLIVEIREDGVIDYSLEIALIRGGLNELGLRLNSPDIEGWIERSRAKRGITSPLIPGTYGTSDDALPALAEAIEKRCHRQFTSPTIQKMKPGDRVCLRSNPEKTGTITGFHGHVPTAKFMVRSDRTGKEVPFAGADLELISEPSIKPRKAS